MEQYENLFTVAWTGYFPGLEPVIAIYEVT